MRRHLRGPSGDKQDPPEAQSPATAYGSAIHDCISRSEEGLSDQEAVEKSFEHWGGWLEPPDVERLFHDLETYHARDYRGVRTMASEDDLRVPLMEHEGETIYFRFKLDRLYQRLDDEGAFIHIDYKSSRHAKSQEEVNGDPQIWAYNWAIFEFWPECERLIQVYDQLRYGTITTRKSEDQRLQIKKWLQTAALAVLQDRDHKPRFNRWCPYCPIANDCPVIPQLTDYSLSRIAALGGVRPVLKKDGTPGKRTAVNLDPDLYDVYAQELPKIKTATKTLEKVAEAIGDTLKEMPAEERARYGYEVQERSKTEFTPQGLKALHERLGDEDFYALVSLAKTKLESHFEGDDEMIEEALGYAEQHVGATVLVGGPDMSP